mgnify:CR=1 FL=1
MVGSRWWGTEWQAILLAVGLLTRIPAPSFDRVSNQHLGRSLHWYPAVGLIIGLVVLGVGSIPLPSFFLATLVVTAWVALTGALHLDGLADCADAWVGGMGDKEKTLAILKDPASGPVAVTALVLTLLLKVSAVSILIEQSASVYLLLIPMLARMLMSLAFLFTPYVRAEGMGQSLARYHSRHAVFVAVAITLMVSVLVLPLSLLVAWSLALGAIFLTWRSAMIKRLNGFTGDGAGALVELSETLLLLIAAALAGGTL